MSVLSLVNAHKSYGRGDASVHAVRGVSLTIDAGEAVGLVGESGCGKSTLTRLLARLDPLDSGQLSFDGVEVSGSRRHEAKRFRRSVQVVFQDPSAALDPRLKVGRSVSEVWSVHPDLVAKGQRADRVKELFAKVGLATDLVDRYPHQLSGGQKQRVCIARALALEPRLVICDEPVSALDVSVQAQIVNLLDDLRRELGVAFLFVAHDLAVVRHFCDRVLVMYGGRIVESGTTDEVFEGPRHPYTRNLLNAIPSGDPRVRRNWSDSLIDVVVRDASAAGCGYRPRCQFAESQCAAEPMLLARGNSEHHLDRCHLSLEPEFRVDGSSG